MDIHATLAHLDKLFAEKRLAEVAPYLNRQLSQALEEGDLGAALSLTNELIGFYRSISQNDAALSMTKKALSLIDAMNLHGSTQHATTLINAATAYRAAGLLDEAANHYDQALTIFERLGEKGYPLASLLNNMSQVYQALGRHRDALPLLERALTLLTPLDGVDAEIATTHTNLALSLIALGEHASARDHLKHALHLFEATNGEHDAHYGAALSAQASLAYHEGDYANAVTLYEKALPEIKASFGENDGYHITQKNLATAREALAKSRQ